MVVYSFFIFDRHGTAAGGASKDLHPSDGALSNGLTKDSHKSGSTDTRLVFGAVFSLRNMVRKLGGEDDKYGPQIQIRAPQQAAGEEGEKMSFVCYRTGQYKLHYYETPTNLKFVMMTDTKANNMRLALHQIYVNLYVEYVVKNPLSPAEHPGGVGVYNELFEESLEQFVTRVLS
ncbi:TRAPP complex subunit Bet5 (predicted) [Trichophyton rubrum]|uniref:Trafficking protein particle complex subunit n=1 Tax=Trichophyton rubrum TaxID=5551 RepID=A0A178F2C2_TRIRU|nr:TRAPP complex subunit Bet5 (predicted) [Trichophyton rubrum]